MRLLTTVTTFVMTLAFLWAGTALAQSRPRGATKLKPPAAAKAKPTPIVARTGVKQTVPKKPAQRLTFDDDLVEAGRAGGGGMLVKGRVKPNHSQLIPIRQDFVPELIKSADYI